MIGRNSDTAGKGGAGYLALILGLALPIAAMAGATSRGQDDSTVDAGLPREIGGRSAELLSAFFGLDNGLLGVANLICRGAAGKDGMPVIFSTELDHTTLQSGDFQVTAQSGQIGTVHCVSFLPATDAGELRTVLLIGEFGDADNDPPARATITGHLHSIDGSLDYRGASIEVTPLEAGPTLVFAERFSAQIEDEGLGLRITRGGNCPADGVIQAVRVVWAGGVTLPNGDEPGEVERDLYQVTVRSRNGGLRAVTPVALADLGDGDNNHLLCLGARDVPVSVSLPAGILVDPNGDLNPATQVQVAP
ncbi:MAG: hypothetical protein ACFCBW_01945 [Candidatus Competibacterales bacterium]